MNRWTEWSNNEPWWRVFFMSSSYFHTFWKARREWFILRVRLLAYINIYCGKIQRRPPKAALIFITSFLFLLPHSEIFRCLSPLGLGHFSICKSCRAKGLRRFGPIKEFELFTLFLYDCSAYQTHSMIESSTYTLASSLLSLTPR